MKRIIRSEHIPIEYRGSVETDGVYRLPLKYNEYYYLKPTDTLPFNNIIDKIKYLIYH